ncbi:MAG: hypothetical protein ACR2NH_02655 [Solirubrobacteraceae bacterium]
MHASAAHIATARAAPSARLAVPVAGFVAIAATVAYGLTVGGAELGSASPPLLYRWRPDAGPFAVASIATLAAAVSLAPRLRAPTLSPRRFAAAAIALGLCLRLGLAVGRDGIEGLYGVYTAPGFEGASEYLPALPALGLGTKPFLDTFAEIGTSLPVNAVGHPPGLLLTLHALGIHTAEGMAALTIGVGALSVALTYVLARELLDEPGARAATLLYAFAPSAVLGGATSADAAYATLALAAAAALLARRQGTPALGAAGFALASFFSYANLGIGAVAALLAARRDGLRRGIGLALGCAVALVAFYGLLHLVTGFDPAGAVRSAESVYREGVASHRPYAFWVLGSPVAFLVAAGLPIAWLALRSLGARENAAVALFAVLAVAALLGFTKAETERIYLFLVPLACVAAAAALPARHLPPTLAALACQALATELLFFTVW